MMGISSGVGTSFWAVVAARIRADGTMMVLWRSIPRMASSTQSWGEMPLSAKTTSARQVTGIGCFQRRIGQTLTGTVRRDEVFEHRKTLLEVRENRVFDDLLTALDT